MNNQGEQVAPANQPIINTAAETAEATKTTIADAIPRQSADQQNSSAQQATTAQPQAAAQPQAQNPTA